MIKRKFVILLFLIIAAPILVKTQTDDKNFINLPLNCSETETPKSDKNIGEHKKLKVSVVSGKTFIYSPGYRKRILKVFEGACLALFSEAEQKLVGKTESGQAGYFTFGNIPAGNYRLVIYHQWNFVKIVNIPIEVLSSESKNKGKKILAYMISNNWAGESFARTRVKLRKIERKAFKY